MAVLVLCLVSAVVMWQPFAATKNEFLMQHALKQSKLGRPTAKPDPIICEKLLEHVANGGTLRAFKRVCHRTVRCIGGWIRIPL